MTQLFAGGIDRDGHESLKVTDTTNFVRLRRRYWKCAALSLGCMAGCATWDEMAQTAAQPWQATGELVARTGDRVGDLFEFDSLRRRNPANLPAYQASNSSLAQSNPAQPARNATIGGRPCQHG